jgi:hypothetical protein
VEGRGTDISTSRIEVSDVDNDVFRAKAWSDRERILDLLKAK